jgi:hypothetical protein
MISGNEMEDKKREEMEAKKNTIQIIQTHP